MLPLISHLSSEGPWLAGCHTLTWDSTPENSQFPAQNLSKQVLIRFIHTHFEHSHFHCGQQQGKSALIASPQGQNPKPCEAAETWDSLWDFGICFRTAAAASLTPNIPNPLHFTLSSLFLALKKSCSDSILFCQQTNGHGLNYKSTHGDGSVAPARKINRNVFFSMQVLEDDEERAHSSLWGTNSSACSTDTLISPLGTAPAALAVSGKL